VKKARGNQRLRDIKMLSEAAINAHGKPMIQIYKQYVYIHNKSGAPSQSPNGECASPISMSLAKCR
jgi:hypothetical protein